MYVPCDGCPSIACLGSCTVQCLVSASFVTVRLSCPTHLPELVHRQVKANAECKGANEDGGHVDRVALEEADL